jgi:hypothetical protein
VHHRPSMSARKFHRPVSNRIVAIRRIAAGGLGLALTMAWSGIVPSPAEASGTSAISATPQPGAWTTSASPNQPGANSNGLGNVSCLSTTFCMAIGAYAGANGETETLAESWNGMAWSVVTTPVQAIYNLWNLSCVSDEQCTAVGSYDTSGGVGQTLIETWNGTAWSIVSSPDEGTGNNSLYGVACTSDGSCVAVGSWTNSSNIVNTLTEMWNGTTWSIVSSPDDGTNNNSLAAVACTSDSSCMAVGSMGNTGTNFSSTLTEAWNGTTWSIVSSPNGTGPGPQNSTLGSISCPNADFCMAVGEEGVYGNSVAESWNGTEWSLVAGDLSGFLNAIWCSSSSWCLAVGDAEDTKGYPQILADSWNGSQWVITAAPTEGRASTLQGVSCQAVDQCIVTGGYNTNGIGMTLAESFDGSTWTVAPTPDIGVDQDELAAVSCRTESSCMAVGNNLSLSDYQETLTESWNGSSWSIEPSEDRGTGNNYLTGISCFSTTECTAVGWYQLPEHASALIESWNGSSWSLDKAVDEPGGTKLSGVSCVSATSCTAVGSYGSGLNQTLVEVWNGRKWSFVPSPDHGKDLSVLDGIDCASVRSCMAVGSYESPKGTERTLVESWKGSGWSIVSSPNEGAQLNTLTSVECSSRQECEAAGSDRNSLGVDQTLVESWNGSDWSISSSPNDSGNNFLVGVSCADNDSCAAVGYTVNNNVQQTLIEAFDGSEWSIVSSPNEGAVGDYLSGVSCVATLACTAAGTSYPGKDSSETLVEQGP